jgi:NTE family protein
MQKQSVASLLALFVSFSVSQAIGDEPSRQTSEQKLSPAPEAQTDLSREIHTPRPHIVLALGGGACKSVAQIGVLRSLEKHHIRIDAIIGSSMGATIGALYCAGKSPDQIEELFINGSIPKAINPHLVLNSGVNMVLAPVTKISHVVRHKPYAGITSGGAFRKELEKELPQSFSQLRIPFAAVATDLTHGRTVVLSTGDLPRALLASSAFPRVVRPVQIGSTVYADGGVKANLPARLAQSELGADVVIAVPVDTSIKPIKNSKLTSMNNLVGRISDIMIAALDAQQSKSSDILIYPDMDDIPLLTKDVRLLKEGIAKGEEAADKALPSIEQRIAEAADRGSHQRSAVSVNGSVRPE